MEKKLFLPFEKEDQTQQRIFGSSNLKKGELNFISGILCAPLFFAYRTHRNMRSSFVSYLRTKYKYKGYFFFIRSEKSISVETNGKGKEENKSELPPLHGMERDSV